MSDFDVAPQYRQHSPRRFGSVTASTAFSYDGETVPVALANGTWNITPEFDDGSTQTLSGVNVSGGTWEIPTTLDRPYIKTIGYEKVA